MSKLVSHASAQTAPLASPCTGVCRMEEGRCAGCLRSLDEIAAWSGMSAAQQRGLLLTLDQRRAAMESARHE